MKFKTGQHLNSEFYKLHLCCFVSFPTTYNLRIMTKTLSAVHQRLSLLVGSESKIFIKGTLSCEVEITLNGVEGF